MLSTNSDGSKDEVSESQKKPSRHGHKRPNYKQRRARGSQSSSSTYETDSPFYGENAQKLRIPSSTSDWDIVCLETLNIFYDDKHLPSPIDIVDMIYAETAVFGPLDEDGEKKVEYLQKSMCFNACFGDIFGDYLPDIVEQLDMEMDKDICNHEKYQGNHLMSALVEEFINSLRLAIGFQHQHVFERRAATTKSTFVDVISLFSRMCGLWPAPGNLFTNRMDIYQQERVSVSSESDIVLIPKVHVKDILKRFGEEKSKFVYVVSVFEVKSLRHQKSVVAEERGKKATRTNSAGRDKDVFSKKQIYNKVKPNILGQHGAELFMHTDCYNQKLVRRKKYMNYCPGMIILGTEVIFTLLAINSKHLRKFESKDEFGLEDKATIFYSEPKDLLKKEDRDILLHALLRLSNVS